ncbi:MAG: HupE/UreJ family protein [Thermoplasmata archaeon]|nr:HupE/UreJ family protein [Thermoplasmata archaeon]
MIPMSEEYEKPLVIPEGGDADPTGLIVPFLVSPATITAQAVAVSITIATAVALVAVSTALVEIIVADTIVYSADSE